MVHLIRKVGNRSTVEKLILVPDVHIEILGGGSVGDHKESVLIESGRWPSRAHRIQVDKNFICGN
ncbi:MAG TPA: hypothetical protein PKD12_01615 [Nitrospira sp.]|nr:hypothetical protein [Nitrospira sp.]